MNGNLKPFQKGRLQLPPRPEFVANLVREHGVSEKEARSHYDNLLADDVWLNDEYQVNVRWAAEHGFGPEMEVAHLSIKRLDKSPIHDWRDLQAIKNMLVGDEFEAVELYPAESRIVDSANQYHLFVFSDAKGKPVRLPFGFMERFVTDDPKMNAKQRARS